MPAAETVAAIATAPGRAGIGVIRVSGRDVSRITEALLGRIPPARSAVLADFRDAAGEPIDRGIAIFFRGPHSYTGEDVLELQGHGGTAVLRLLLQRCLELGARVAEPGEFTKRAFLNDKLDLAQAESVADLIDASSGAAARSAMRSLVGEFSEKVSRIRDGLVELRALVEAVLDFPEEEVDLVEKHQVRSRLAAIRRQVCDLAERAVQGSLLREGARVVLIGRPNVGKSSLMNRLAEEEVAIVTDIPGTTRDALRRELIIGGVPVHVVDTAGLRASTDPVERLGVERSLREMEEADVALEVIDGSTTTSEAQLDLAIPVCAKKVRVINKIDKVGERPHTLKLNGVVSVWVSAKTGAGIDQLREVVLEAVGWQQSDEVPFMARERHIAALRRTIAALEDADRSIVELEIFAEELRAAQTALGEIVGEISADDLLGEIFSRFCIGK